MQRSFTFVCLLVVCFVCLGPVVAQGAPTPEPVGLRPDAPQYALNGPYWVGTQEFEAETAFHPTSVRVWYPALNPDESPEDITYIAGEGITAAGHAILNAAPDSTAGPYPLVIFSHGNGGSRFEAPYLTEHLASYGFVVMAINYDDASTSGPQIYTRPMDVTWQIDLAQELTGTEGDTLFGMIDPEQIAVAGHSLGADTILMAGGAQLDFSSSDSLCALYPDMMVLAPPRPLSEFCDEWTQSLIDFLGLEAAPEGLWPSWGDPRIDALVPYAPDLILFGPESLAGVTVPTLTMVGSHDTAVMSELPEYRPYMYESVSSASKALVELAGADHMVYASGCDAVPWAIDYGYFWACSDPVWDMDRAHDLINHFTTAFLLSTLKGDAEAAAALSPEAVAFPGIAYQAEGF